MMKTYAINIITDTRDGDAFDSVAVNKFPILFTANSAEELFTEEAFINHVRGLLKYENLYNKSKVFIRTIEGDRSVDVVYHLPEKIPFKNKQE